MNSFLKKTANTVSAVWLLAMAAIFLNYPTAISSAIADGDAAVFKSKCAPCHGADGSGNTAMGKKLSVRNMGSSEVQNQSDAQLYNIIAKGKGKMPGYEKSLSRQQIDQLVAYIRQLGKKG